MKKKEKIDIENFFCPDNNVLKKEGEYYIMEMSGGWQIWTDEPIKYLVELGSEPINNRFELLDIR